MRCSGLGIKRPWVLCICCTFSSRLDESRLQKRHSVGMNADSVSSSTSSETALSASPSGSLPLVGEMVACSGSAPSIFLT